MNPKQKPLMVPTGGSRSRETHTRLGQATVKVSGADTQGAFVVFEVTVVPSGGPPLHIHHVENEWSMYLRRNGVPRWRRYISGKLLWSLFAPGMFPHTFRNVGQEDAKILALAVPSGRMEAFIVKLDALVAAGVPEPDSLRKVFEKYDFELVGPCAPAV